MIALWDQEQTEATVAAKKSKTRTGTTRPRLGYWLLTPNRAAYEIARLAGYDTLIVDMEHGIFSQDSADPTVAAGKALGFTVYVRVAEAARVPIQQALDAGAHGVILPHIDSLAHAREVTAYAKYPPLGTRSVGAGRTWDFGGAPKDFAGHANRSTVCYAMIETAGALKDAAAIARLSTVDGLFNGSFDLGMSRRGRIFSGSPADLADLAAIAAAARAAGKPWSMIVGQHEYRLYCRRHGIGMAVVADEYGVHTTGAGLLLAAARADFGGGGTRRGQ